MKQININRKILLFTTTAITFFPLYAFSSNLEGEKPFAEFRNADGSSTMRFAAYMQARAEYGDLVVGADQTVQSSEFDIYFRKVAFGAYGNAFYKGLKYGITFSGDQTPQKSVIPTFSEEDGVALNDAFLQYFYNTTDYVKFGKGKFPLSRIYLISSTKQLFAERPYYVYAWENVLKSYAATNLSAGGKAFDSNLSYNISVSKAWRYGEELYKGEGSKVSRSSPFIAARVEWSPSQWKEKEFSDTPMGQGRHFSIGSYVARQGIDYSLTGFGGKELRLLYGANISSNIKNITLQAEINGTQVRSDIQGKDKSGRGWLVQGGYLIQPQMIEPVLRYEFFNENTNVPNSTAKTITLGVNKYINGNNLKFGLNLEHSNFGDNFNIQRPNGRSTKDVIRATLQFVL